MDAFEQMPRSDLVDVKLSEADLEERVLIMLQKESKYLPDPTYIENVQQDGMKVLWRRRVTEWLLEFQEEYGISQDTVAVAVNYMDRYLSKMSTKKGILQLLAMGCIFIAAKLHETYPIGMKELESLAENLYFVSDIKLMELEILRVISWNLNPITPQLFMNHLVCYVDCPREREALREHAGAFLDATMSEYQFLNYKPSIQGVAALICAFDSTQISRVAWSKAVSKYEFTTQYDVQCCASSMRDVFSLSFSDGFRNDAYSPVGVEQFASAADDMDHETEMLDNGQHYGKGSFHDSQQGPACFDGTPPEPSPLYRQPNAINVAR